MATVALTAENFDAEVQKPGVLIIDWWAPWCGPCRVFGPIYETASDKHTAVVFGKINTEDQPALAATFQIQAIPTLMVFRDQVLVFARPGVIPAPALDELVEKVLALDMDEVRREIAAQENAGAPEGEDAPEGADAPEGEEMTAGSKDPAP